MINLRSLLKDLFLGQPVTSVGVFARNSESEIEIRSHFGQRPIAEIIPNALTEAISDLIYQHIRPLVMYAPDTKFQVHQIRLLMTPENMSLLGDLAAVSREIRNKVAIGSMKKATGAESIDFSKFYDFRIECQPHKDADRIITVIAGNGPDKVQLIFEFYGEPVSKEVDAEEDTLLTLIVREPGQAARTHCFSKLPISIGRNSNADIVLDSRVVSRQHLTIQAGQRGQLIVQDHSRAGTSIDRIGQKLESGVATLAPNQGILILAPDAVAEAVQIEFQLTVPARDREATILSNKGEPFFNLREMGTILPKEQKTAEATSVAPPPKKAEEGQTNLPTVVSNDDTEVHKVWRNNSALARLRIRKSDGSEELIDITDLPFIIGRESQADQGYLVPADYSKVSRLHLSLEKFQGGSFMVENLQHLHNGTWHKAERLGERFSWEPIAKPSSSEGWYILGGKYPNTQSLSVRLEAVR